MSSPPRGLGTNKNVSLGTAAWMPQEAMEALAYSEGAVWLGRSSTPSHTPIGWGDDRHVVTVAGTRAGKGTSLIIPNLCLYPGSVVCIDPKGENATITAARRGNGSDSISGLGQSVYVLDPFDTAQIEGAYRASFNPLDWIDIDSPEASDEAKRLADSLVVVSKGEDAHWDETARSVIQGLILHVLSAHEHEGRRNLLTVHDLLMRGDGEGVQIYVDMRRESDPDFEMPEPSKAAFDFLWKSMAESTAFNKIVSHVGSSVLSLSDRELSSVLSTARRNTDFLSSPRMATVLEHSTFSLDTLKTAAAGATVYLCLPARYMNTHARWLRMMVGLTLDRMEQVRGKPATGSPVLMLLDEFAILERMASLEKAIGQIAGFGVKIWVILQDLTQLKALYKDRWETFLGNAGLATFFGNADQFTLEYISRRLGKVEVRKDVTNRGEQIGTGSGSSYSPGGLMGMGAIASLVPGLSKSRQEGIAWGTSETVQKTELLNSDEVAKTFAAETGLMLAITPNHHPMMVRRTPYFSDPAFNGLYSGHGDHPLPERSNVSVVVAQPSSTDRQEPERLYAPDMIEGFFRQPTHGTLTKWHAQVGQSFRAGELIAEVETRQQFIEVVALRDGVMRSHAVIVGDIVRSGSHIADFVSN